MKESVLSLNIGFPTFKFPASSKNLLRLTIQYYFGRFLYTIKRL